MADPEGYEPQYDFSNYQASKPSRPLPGHELDVELLNISNAIGQTNEALGDVRRSDGRLQNGIVDADAIGPTAVGALIGQSTELMEDVVFITQMYLGQLAEAPTTGRDGVPLAPSHWYYDTVLEGYQYYDGVQFRPMSAPAPGLAFDFGPFTGNGVTTTFTLPAAATGTSQVYLFRDGVAQADDQYSVSGTTLTISPAMKSGEIAFGKVLVNSDASAATANAIFYASGETLQDYVDRAGSYATRAALVAALGLAWAAGAVVSAGGYDYRYLGTGTAISDMPGWVPHGDVFPQHFGAVANGTTDDSAAINAALAYSSVVYGRGAYGVGATITGVNKAFLGQHSIGPQRSRLIGLSAVLPITSPIVELGGASKFDGWLIEYDALTGTETRGQRIGLSTGYAGNILQRGSTLDNLRFDNVGTALTDKGVGGFSITFGTISVARYSYAAADFYSVGATGNEWGNFYAGAVSSTFTPTYGINIEGSASGGSFGQINVEHTTFSRAAVRFAKSKNISVDLLHLEGVGTSAAGLRYIELDECSPEIANLEVLHTQALYDDLALFELKSAAFNTGVSYAGTSTKNQLTIGTMQLRGLAAPDIPTYPSYPSGRRGLANVAGWKFFRRDGAYANTDYKVRVGTFTWAAYPGQASDPAIFAAASTTYSDRARIDFVSFGDLGVETAKPFSRSMFGSDAEFTTAATAAGLSFPTPYMTRFDLPPQNIDIMHSGVIPSNSAGDAANNVSAIQALIDWLNGKTNGGTITGGAFHPSYSNPVIALNASLVLKNKVTIDVAKTLRFRATSAMTAVIDTVVGAGNRLSRRAIRGGVWDLNSLAQSAFRLRDFQTMEIADFEITNWTDYPAIYIGDVSASANCYEARIHGGLIRRAIGTPFTTQDPIGVYSDLVTDSYINDVNIQGAKYGVKGTFFACDFSMIHPWSFPATDGTMLDAFDITGNNNKFSQCYADNAEDNGFKFDGTGNSLMNSRTLRNTTVTDNGGACVRLASGATLDVIGCSFNGASGSARWASGFAGDLTGLTARHNRFTNVVAGTEERNAGVLLSGSYTPTLTAGTNLDAVTNNGVAQYFVTGKMVTVFGVVNIDPTAAGLFNFRMTLPIARDITALSQLAGTFSAVSAGSTNTGGIQGDTTNDAALFGGYANSTANIGYAYQFSYILP